MVWVGLMEEADEELAALPRAEEVAMRSVIAKLEALGTRLPYPHQSAVRGVKGMRELRPRSGRSAWRAFYRRIGAEKFLIASVGPEALVNPRGFDRSVSLAGQRLATHDEYGGGR